MSRGSSSSGRERPWIKATDRGNWVDFAAINEHLGALSGGEQRLLRIAASIGSDEATPVRLGIVLSGLDRPTLRLVLAAVSHAGGSHEHSSLTINRDGRATIAREPSLFMWDGEGPSTGQA